MKLIFCSPTKAAGGTLCSQLNLTLLNEDRMCDCGETSSALGLGKKARISFILEQGEVGQPNAGLLQERSASQ